MSETIQKHMDGFRAACAKLNIPAELPQAPSMPQKFQDWIQAKAILAVKIAAKRNGITLDYNNRDQRKYEPWFWMNDQDGDPAGSGFRLHEVNCDYAGTDVGAPFVFLSEDEAEQFVEEHIDLYKIANKDIF